MWSLHKISSGINSWVWSGCFQGILSVWGCPQKHWLEITSFINNSRGWLFFFSLLICIYLFVSRQVVCRPRFSSLGPELEKAEMVFFENRKLRLSNRCDFLTWGFKSSRDTQKLWILGLLLQVSVILLSWSIDLWGAVKDDHCAHPLFGDGQVFCGTSLLNFWKGIGGIISSLD